jgi:hypothetical protein
MGSSGGATVAPDGRRTFRRALLRGRRRTDFFFALELPFPGSLVAIVP